jgi:hypothetical protein
MFCVIGSDAPTGFAASGAEASGMGNAADDGARCCAASLAPMPDDDDVVVDVPTDAESSAPQPFNDKVASAINAAPLARRVSVLMSASVFVRAGAVSNPFKK